MSNSKSTLSTFSDLANVGNFVQLDSLNKKMAGLQSALLHEGEHARNQAALRDVIFEVRTFLEKRLPAIKDKAIKSFVVEQIEKTLNKSNITPKSFDTISDKQYFSETIEILSKADSGLFEFKNEAISIERDILRSNQIRQNLDILNGPYSKLQTDIESRKTLLAFCCVLTAILLSLIFIGLYNLLSYIVAIGSMVMAVYLWGRSGEDQEKLKTLFMASTTSMIKDPLNPEPDDFDSAAKLLEELKHEYAQRINEHISAHPELSQFITNDVAA